MTDSARRAIFWARKEAHELRSPDIRSEHLLYGVVREDEPLLRHLAGPDFEIIQQRLEFSGPRHPDLHQDLPLNEESKEVLKSFMAEADKAGDWIIGTQHLVAGFLLLPESQGAKILLESGLTLEKIREEISQRPRQ